MEPVPPDRDAFLLPPSTRETIYAPDQIGPDGVKYIPLPALQLEDGRVVSQWQPSQDEIDALLGGEPVTLVLHTFGDPLQPIILAVGGLDLR